ncbi:MAG: HAMP domain-containing protein, partial [Delftia sp.]|nr:HAMP domain-containing protein [Delftia sp.]
GESGESYLVGQDYLMRSNSRFLDQLGVDSTVLNAEWPVNTVAARRALDNISDIQIIDDYRGTKVLSAWAPLVLQEPDRDDPQGIIWAVIAEIDESEALASANQLETTILQLVLGALLVVGLVAVLVGLWIAGRLIQPILGLTEGATAIADGDLDVSLAVTRRDELGVLAGSLSRMTISLREMIASLQERGEELVERAREMEASQRVTFAASERTTPDALLDLVVNLIRDQFHLYHVQVYLVDEEQQVAVLRKSTGYAGRRLLQRGHQIPLDRTALVTRAIHSGQSVLVDDTSADPNFMPNPLLPYTRSELAVPLQLADKIIGVLDAQDRVPGR